MVERQARRETANAEAGPSAAPASGVTGCIVGHCEVPLWGMSPGERLRRSLARAGVQRVLAEGEALPRAGSALLLRADHVFDEAVVRQLLRCRDIVLTLDGGERPRPVAAHVGAAQAKAVTALLCGAPGAAAPEGLSIVTQAELGLAYREMLRKREAPYILALSEATRRGVEWRMFKGSYKGVTDFVTKWLWPRPAFWATRLAARWHLTPNLVTALSLALVVWAFFLFLDGRMLSGLAVAWVMTFLDTVDGKLARVTLTSSQLGNVFDHGIDLIHPPFWYVAWGLGLAAAGAPPLASPELVFAVIILGYVGGRLIEGIFTWVFKIQIHIWRPIDSLFRLITARRNPNLVLLTVGALLGRPDLGLLAVAAWTAVSFGFHAWRLALALLARLRAERIESWLAASSRPS